MYLVILGRIRALALAELEAVFGASKITYHGGEYALVDADDFRLENFGGVKKVGRVVAETTFDVLKNDGNTIYDIITDILASSGGKITLGLSAYDIDLSRPDLTNLGLKAKARFKKDGRGLRLVPSPQPALNTASSHHNKLGLSPNKIELLIVGNGSKVTIAASLGAQNITAYAKRDQARPARDAFVGMLPPKLAQIITNLAAAANQARATNSPTLLDPFCGTGGLLQEACLNGYRVYGTDLSSKMIDYSRRNLTWLEAKYHKKYDYQLAVGDATKYHWTKPIDMVATETYLGLPLNALPSPTKLAEIQHICQKIVLGFLSNLAPQIQAGTRLCLAIPAWKKPDGNYQRLNVLDSIKKMGYNQVSFKQARQEDLLYHRDSQIVGRELLVLIRS
jgi:tRNA (guanine10-N2)-dimethyltransferase